jgi:tetratricopeptide (TPR) repeat protein
MKLKVWLNWLFVLFVAWFTITIHAQEKSNWMRISAILVATESEAQQLLHQLNAGADFSEIARQHSIGLGKGEGGDLGYYAPGDMMSELESEAMQLQVGDYSGVVETGSGYFILMKTEEMTAAEYTSMKNKENRWNALLRQVGELYQQDRYEEAEPIAKEALHLAEANFSAQDLRLAASLNNMGLLYKAQYRYAKAEPLYQRALVILEKSFGSNHPEVATSLNNLGELYRAQGRYAEAEPLYQRALVILEKSFGSDHLNVALSLNNLGLLYNSQGRYNEAESLLKRALVIREEALGPDHPEVATFRNNLALCYYDQGKYMEAEPLFKQALAIREETLGPDHPDVATVLRSMADLYEDMGNRDEAKRCRERAEEIQSSNQVNYLWSVWPILLIALLLYIFVRRRKSAVVSISTSEIRKVIKPLRLIFWGGLVHLFDFTVRQTVNGVEREFDLLNDLIGLLMITWGVFQLFKVNVHDRYLKAMHFVIVVAILSCLDEIFSKAYHDIPPLISFFQSVLSIAAMIAIVVFCMAMRWLSTESGFRVSARSWRTTTLLFVVIYSIPLGLFYGYAAVTIAAGTSTDLNFGSYSSLLILVLFIPLIHFFISTSRMKAEAVSSIGIGQQDDHLDEDSDGAPL